MATELRALVDELPEQAADARWLALPATTPPWTGTGVEVTAGDTVTLLAEGRVVMNEELGLWNGPSLHLWARVGGRGPLFNGHADTHTFRAPHDGEIELCIYQGEWASEDGVLATDEAAYAALSGGLEVLVIRWLGNASDGLRAVKQAVPHPLAAAELARLENPVRTPTGWEYLWFLGPAGIFRSAEIEGRDAIVAETSDDVGILRKPVSFPLGPETRLRWRWKLDELPSPVAEDDLLHHDYLSVALEFENGQDLTWYWSAALPAETSFRCPLPNWDARETHLVVRSGAEGLGAWHSEERAVLADYERAVGPAPARIVAAWLIGVSVFQKRTGRGAFAGIELADGEQQLTVL